MNVALTSTTNELDMASALSDLCGYSVKLRALAALAYQICIISKRKLLVFCDWPVTQWNVELFLTNLCFEIGSIRAVHKAQDRKDIIHDFNKNGSEINVLVTSLAAAKIVPVIAGQADLKVDDTDRNEHRGKHGCPSDQTPEALEAERQEIIEAKCDTTYQELFEKMSEDGANSVAFRDDITGPNAVPPINGLPCILATCSDTLGG
ncbi:MAG: hypothetical protein Q9202_004784 [Teloschistes flavicans]